MLLSGTAEDKVLDRPSNFCEQQSSENINSAPPLPPLPPPPPPPPDESPPPLPDSPPPLPLDPAQPLPPGVDEPEYAVYRRVSPKHSYKKTSSDSATYSAELMMTYGYTLPVQQVVSNGQAMTVPIQPIEYHTYMHDSVSNPYLVQSAHTSSHVIQCSAKKPKLSLKSELMSFYSDIAQLDAANESNSNSETPIVTCASTPNITTPPVTTAPATVVTTTTTTTASVVPAVSSIAKATETLPSNGITLKKKKKVMFVMILEFKIML